MKTLAIFALLVCFAVQAIPGQQPPGASQPKKESRTEIPTTFTVNNYDVSNHDQQKTEDGPQGWHKLVTWPEGITAWAIILTLISISYQSYWTRKAAEAAVRQTKSLMNIERGFILIDWDDLDLTDNEHWPKDGDANISFVFTAKNTGNTPVFLLEYSTKFLMLRSTDDLPAKPRYSPKSLKDEPVIPKKTSNPLRVDLEKVVPFRDLHDVLITGEYVLYVFGFVKYLDVFKQEHYTRYGLRYQPDPNQPHSWSGGGFRIDGPDAYNGYS